MTLTEAMGVISALDDLVDKYNLEFQRGRTDLSSRVILKVNLGNYGHPKRFEGDSVVDVIWKAMAWVDNQEQPQP